MSEANPPSGPSSTAHGTAEEHIDPSAIDDDKSEPLVLDTAPEPPTCPAPDCQETMVSHQSQGGHHRIQRTFVCPDCRRLSTIVHMWGPLSDLQADRLSRHQKRFPAHFAPPAAASAIDDHCRDGRYRFDTVGPHHILVTLPDVDADTLDHLTSLLSHQHVRLSRGPDDNWLSVVDDHHADTPMVELAPHYLRTDAGEADTSDTGARDSDADAPSADDGPSADSADVRPDGGHLPTGVPASTTPEAGATVSTDTAVATPDAPEPPTRSTDVGTTPDTDRARVDVEHPWFIDGDPDSGFELLEVPTPLDERSDTPESPAESRQLSLPTGDDDATFAIDEARTERALTEAMIVTLAESGGIYEVDSSSGNTYRVDLLDGECSCPDREPICKHLRRVAISLKAKRIPGPDGSLP